MAAKATQTLILTKSTCLSILLSMRWQESPKFTSTLFQGLDPTWLSSLSTSLACLRKPLMLLSRTTSKSKKIDRSRVDNELNGISLRKKRSKTKSPMNPIGTPKLGYLRRKSGPRLTMLLSSLAQLSTSSVSTLWAKTELSLKSRSYSH